MVYTSLYIGGKGILHLKEFKYSLCRLVLEDKESIPDHTLDKFWQKVRQWGRQNDHRLFMKDIFHGKIGREDEKKIRSHHRKCYKGHSK